MSNTTDNRVESPLGDLDRNVSRIVKILMVLAQMEQRHLATALGMDKATLSRALHGVRAWKLDDIRRLAIVFDRPIAYFFEDADDLVARIRNRCFREYEQLTFAA